MKEHTYIYIHIYISYITVTTIMQENVENITRIVYIFQRMTVENIPIVATFLDSYFFYRKHQKENGTEEREGGERGRSIREEWEETQDGRGETVGKEREGGEGRGGNVRNRREEKKIKKC